MKLLDKFYDIQGKPIKELVLFGIPIFTLSMTTPKHYNFFLFCLPLFRINKNDKSYTIHLLVLVWFYKLVMKILDPVIKVYKRIYYLNNVEKYYSKPQYQKTLQDKINRGEKLKVVLFESRISCWQYEELYKLLDESEFFTPVVVLKPFMFQGKQVMAELMDEAYDILKKRNYNVIKGYNAETDNFFDVRSELKPDIVFYSMFWKPHFEESFYINVFEDIYSFLFPYCIDVASHPVDECVNFELQNKVTRYYLPTTIHQAICVENMDNKAVNTFVTGSPKLDLFLDENYIANDVWKFQKKNKKRIIWAPHHSDGFSTEYYQFNAFFQIYDFMFEMAEKYKDDVQFAFKPHPMLKHKLEQKWGVEAANRYYSKWKNLENGQLELGEFKDLFIGSDAMILDSLSFISEYTILDKPAFFTIGETSRVNLNLYGSENFKVLYKTEENLEKDIEEFIVNVVINGNDAMTDARKAFIKKYLKSPNGKSASQNIYDDMVDVIINGRYNITSANSTDN